MLPRASSRPPIEAARPARVPFRSKRAIPSGKLLNLRCPCPPLATLESRRPLTMAGSMRTRGIGRIISDICIRPIPLLVAGSSPAWRIRSGFSRSSRVDREAVMGRIESCGCGEEERSARTFWKTRRAAGRVMASTREICVASVACFPCACASKNGSVKICHQISAQLVKRASFELKRERGRTKTKRCPSPCPPIRIIAPPISFSLRARVLYLAPSRNSCPTANRSPFPPTTPPPTDPSPSLQHEADEAGRESDSKVCSDGRDEEREEDAEEDPSMKPTVISEWVRWMGGM